MKQLIFLFAAAILSLTSCSKDDDKDNDTNANNSDANKLPKSEVSTVEPDGSISIRKYTFDGTKISSIATSNKNKTVYTYTADVLSKTEQKVNDITVSYTEYVYEKGDIKSTTTYSVAADQTSTKINSVSYTYDEAKKTQTVQQTDFFKGAPTVSKTTTVNTYDDKNLIKSVVTTIVDDKNDTTTIIDYVYDNQSNYFINVTGQPATIAKSTNNIVTINTKVIVRTNNVIGTPETTQETFEYAYNGSFPSDVKNYNGGKLRNTKNVYYN